MTPGNKAFGQGCEFFNECLVVGDSNSAAKSCGVLLSLLLVGATDLLIPADASAIEHAQTHQLPTF